MKKYIKPNFKEIKLDTLDIIATSGSPFTKGNDIASAGETEFKDVWEKHLIN